VRGCAVGEHLSRLAALLGERTGNKSARQIVAKETAGNSRRVQVDDYIVEVWEKTGKKITRKMIWEKAGYKSRTTFERWERQDPKRPNKAADNNFTRILHDKPHLK
jgi:hypothetical protein